MSKDLKDSQWSQYDQNFHEWAAARGLCKWGELISPFMAVVWPPNNLSGAQLQDPSRRGRLTSTSATDVMMTLPVTDLSAAMPIDAGLW